MGRGRIFFFKLSSWEKKLLDFYNKLSQNDSNNINNYFTNKNKILYLINDMKKFNLDKKNLLITIDNILKNEAQ